MKVNRKISILILCGIYVAILAIFLNCGEERLSSFRRTTSEYGDYLHTKKLADTVFVETYLTGDEGALGGSEYYSLLTDSNHYLYPIGTYDSDCTLDFRIFEGKVYVSAFTKINASIPKLREIYGLPDNVPWIDDYKRLDDTLIFDISSSSHR